MQFLFVPAFTAGMEHRCALPTSKYWGRKLRLCVSSFRFENESDDAFNYFLSYTCRSVFFD